MCYLTSGVYTSIRATRDRQRWLLLSPQHKPERVLYSPLDRAHSWLSCPAMKLSAVISQIKPKPDLIDVIFRGDQFVGDVRPPERVRGNCCP